MELMGRVARGHGGALLEECPVDIARLTHGDCCLDPPRLGGWYLNTFETKYAHGHSHKNTILEINAKLILLRIVATSSPFLLSPGTSRRPGDFSDTFLFLSLHGLIGCRFQNEWGSGTSRPAKAEEWDK